MATFSDDYQKATNEATLALLENIKEAAKESSKLNAGGRAEALNNLAEAYAWITNPAQPHA